MEKLLKDQFTKTTRFYTLKPWRNVKVILNGFIVARKRIMMHMLELQLARMNANTALLTLEQLNKELNKVNYNISTGTRSLKIDLASRRLAVKEIFNKFNEYTRGACTLESVYAQAKLDIYYTNKISINRFGNKIKLPIINAMDFKAAGGIPLRAGILSVRIEKHSDSHYRACVEFELYDTADML